jgi:hypothetical protein
MKMSAIVRIAAVAVLASAPMLAQADNSVKQCMNVFANQNFADRDTTFRVAADHSGRRPLVSSSRKVEVKLAASDRLTGELLATATCTVKHGVATLNKLNTTDMVASR